MSVLKCEDMFNPDDPEATIAYVKNQPERTGNKIKHIIIIYQDDNNFCRVAASKADFINHLGLLEIGKSIINRWGDGEDV